LASHRSDLRLLALYNLLVSALCVSLCPSFSVCLLPM